MRQGSAVAGGQHDVGNDFFAVWLDRRLVYSCACFATPATTLDVGYGCGPAQLPLRPWW